MHERGFRLWVLEDDDSLLLLLLLWPFLMSSTLEEGDAEEGGDMDGTTINMDSAS
jgi:hypothetical protein